MAQTVRIDPTSHAILTELAQAKRLSLTDVLARAIEAYRREVFLEGVAADFTALRLDEAAWQAEGEELAAWEGTVADGLEDE